MTHTAHHAPTPPTITRIDATLEATQTVAWPHFAGSTLRGAFGRALRRAACITGQPDCKGCALRTSCAYGVVFDPAPPAHPLHPSFNDGLPRYLVQAPPLGACPLSPGQTQHFSLLLLPGSEAHHRLIEHILPAAVEKQLFQPGLFKLVHTQTSQTPATPQTKPEPSANPHAPSQITLRWLTPLRLQQQGKPLFKPQQLDATTLARALLRRQLQWRQLTQTTPPADTPADSLAHTQAAAQCTLNTHNLHWHDIQRHSGTQNQKLPLGGLIGSAQLRGPHSALQQLLPLLQLGEHIHIGKETVMGLGRYQLSAIEPG
ncbi:MAG: CRISPR system precrRNA processing endoribonuclease RAMP protein Cas6 [Hydrogenophaga sp.]|nr:CRISPR system precrRNA processing endoribonuclease RAMP protein Cas6 [Hydrogenophaga sp.]